jgi:hypothetical protein
MESETPLANSRPSRRAKFSADEDAQLADLVRIYGDEDWPTISCLLAGRNARQCRERWRHYLCPTVSLAPFTPEEDALLIQKFYELGPKWKTIAAYFDSRTDITVKNRFLLLGRHRRRAETAIEEVAQSLPIRPPMRTPMLPTFAVPLPRRPPPPPALESPKQPERDQIPWSDDDDPRKTYAESTELNGDYLCLGFDCLH